MKKITKGLNYIRHHGIMMAIFYLIKLFTFYIRRITGLGRYATKKVNNRYLMKLDLCDDGISKALYLYGTRERDQVSIVESAVKPGMSVLDIGANIGYYALLEASLLNGKGRVYAFEPHPSNFSMLKKNITLNSAEGNIESFEKGMSNREGSLEFFVSKRSNLHTMNPTYFNTDERKGSFVDSIKVEVDDISRFLKNNRVDLIRMDIEGHEVEVLKGLYKVLDDMGSYPSVLFETHLPKYDDNEHNMKEILSKFFAKGYYTDAIISNNEETTPFKNPSKIIKTDGVYRGIYHGIEDEEALRCVCDKGGVRAIFLKACKDNLCKR